MRCGAFHRVEGTLCLVRHGQAALSGSKNKAPGFAGGYLLRFRHVISGSLALASLNRTCRNLVPTFPQRKGRFWLIEPTGSPASKRMRIPVSEAKRRLTELARRAKAGDEIILTRHGQPIVRLVSVRA